MVKIAIATGSMAGVEHIYDAYLIGRALAGAGHEVLHIAEDLRKLQSLSDAGPPLKLLQAPMAGAASLQSLSVAERPEGFAAQLVQAGFGDVETLRLLAGAWTTLLQAVAPHAVVALSSPVAWLTGPTFASTFAIGRGAVLPPMSAPAVMSPASETSGIDPVLLLGTVNTVMAELDLERLNELPDLLWRCRQSHYGLDALDPYSGCRLIPSFGVFGLAPAATARADGRLAIFLDADYPGIDALVLALSALADLQLDVFIRGAKPAMRRFLNGYGHVALHQSFAAAMSQVGKAAAIVHHGVPAIAEQGVLAGLPHLLLPWTAEQHGTLELVKNLGAAWWKEPGCTVEELIGTLRGLAQEPAIRRAAEEARRTIRARGIGEALKPMVALINEAAGEHSRAQNTAAAESDRVQIDMTVADSPTPLISPLTPSPEESKVFCALPFQHMCIGTEGTARICCMSPDLVSDDKKIPLSLYTKSADEIWNSDHMREVRRKILADEPLAECKTCYDNEAATSTSYRTNTGLHPFSDQPLDAETLRREAIANDFRVATLPQFIKLELGNLCNLRCRMCWGGNSSEIERDPVHSMWSGGADPMHAVWQGDAALIGPDGKIGVMRSGVHDRETTAHGSLCWTDGKARFDVPLGPLNRPDRIVIDFDGMVPFHRTCRISLNGRLAHAAQIGGGVRSIALDIDPDRLDRGLTIDIESERDWNRERHRWEGVPLAAIRLHRQATEAPGGPQVVIKPRLAKPGLWYNDDALVFNELLGDARSLKRFYVTGGEPLLEPRYGEILDYLITKGVAQNIDMELTTNATMVDEKILDKLAQFKSLLLTISVDGVGPVQEYIRFPARWSTIARNIKALKRPNFAIYAVPVVQCYNMLDLANICDFTREAGIHVSLMNNLQDPKWLQTSVMPVSVHRRAAEKLRRMLERDGDDYVRTQAETLVSHFSSFDAPLDHDMLRKFNLFTNDLDVSRGQSFRDALPELFELIEEAGYRWSDETKHIGKVGQRRPARERAHAWI